MGRPTAYTPELAEAILDRLASGESLRSICDDQAMPYRRDVKRWRDEDAEFQSRYARAREIGFDQLADETLGIADECFQDSDAIAKAKLQVDTRKWLLSKLAPRTYGDKMAVDLSSPPGAPVRVEVAANPETLDELSGILSEILGPRS